MAMNWDELTYDEQEDIVADESPQDAPVVEEAAPATTADLIRILAEMDGNKPGAAKEVSSYTVWCSDSTKDEYEADTLYYTENGFLELYLKGEVIAVYAPGVWMSAVKG